MAFGVVGLDEDVAVPSLDAAGDVGACLRDVSIASVFHFHRDSLESRVWGLDC